MEYEGSISDDIVVVEKSKYIFLIFELERMDKLVKLYHDHYKKLEGHFRRVNDIIDNVGDDTDAKR